MSLGEKDYGKVFLLRSDQIPLKPMEKKKKLLLTLSSGPYRNQSDDN